MVGLLIAKYRQKVVDKQAFLSWSSSTGAAHYNVKRSTTHNSGYATIGTPTGTNYTDTAGLTNGQTYYYVVTA